MDGFHHIGIYPILQDNTTWFLAADLDPQLPCFIVKKNQLLRSLSSIDFSFIMQENISKIFKILHEYKLKVGLIQNSAISFSICIEDQYNNFEAVKIILSKKFKVAYNENVSLEDLA